MPKWIVRYGTYFLFSQSLFWYLVSFSIIWYCLLSCGIFAFWGQLFGGLKYNKVSWVGQTGDWWYTWYDGY